VSASGSVQSVCMTNATKRHRWYLLKYVGICHVSRGCVGTHRAGIILVPMNIKNGGLFNYHGRRRAEERKDLPRPSEDQG